MPSDWEDGVYVLPYRVVLLNGERLVVGGAAVRVKASARAPSVLSLLRPRQPTVPEILARPANLPFAHVGPNYLLFDLKANRKGTASH